MNKDDSLNLILLFAGLVLLLIFFYIMKPASNAPVNAHVCTEAEKTAQACTLEYNPVCGSDNVTYGNGCAACSSKVDYYVMGEC